MTRSILEQANLDSDRAKRSYHKRAELVCKRLRDNYAKLINRPLTKAGRPRKFL